MVRFALLYIQLSLGALCLAWLSREVPEALILVRFVNVLVGPAVFAAWLRLPAVRLAADSGVAA